MNYETSDYDGKFITISDNYDLKITSNCHKPGIETANVVLHVNCGNSCGIRVNSVTKAAQSMRIAGGKKSAPESNPWIVSLYSNGTFICGGSIIDTKWVQVNLARLMFGKLFIDNIFRS